MHFIIGVLLYTVFISLFVYFRQKCNSYRAFEAAAKQYGCKRAKKYPHHDSIWGTDLVRERTKAVGEGRQMGLFMEQINKIGKTFEENFFGTKVINTVEVRNIQQVCALAFEDYGKPAQNFFKSFLGDGVLSLDGKAVSSTMPHVLILSRC
ncbi:hypothetical protein OCU04_009171 [Sclerotinia nivalis]|uniref:Uncharacterized protein n=1 Tax=Sclerotinia nivalis TaxID=352851 RepID=A0A9X0AHX2_9HELO|nr:hypothetical protein OCU04_009171 [Sclerotinia nivalis]